MERTRKEIQNLVSFLKFLSAHYKDEFVEEIHNLQCAVEEIEETEENENNFWYFETIRLKNENEMLRKDLQELSKEYFKK